MDEEKKLKANICIVQALLFAFQALFFGITGLVLGYDATILFLYYATSVTLHAAVLIALLLLRDKFRFEDGTCCENINIPNSLTLFRISSIPTIFFLFIGELSESSLFIIIPFVAIVFITDFLDGIIARSLKQITTIGKYLDSSSDYLLLFFTSIIFFVYSLIPLWFFVLIVIRLVSHAGGIILLSALKKTIVFSTSLLGKASIAATMILFVLELVRYYVVKMAFLEPIYIAIEIVAGAIISASLVEKLAILWKEWRGK